MRVRILKKSKNEEGYEKTINLNSQGSADLMSAPPGQEIFSPGKKERRRNSGALSRLSDAARWKKSLFAARCESSNGF